MAEAEVYDSPSGSHRHKYDPCGEVWEHSDWCAFDDSAHECPKCGRENRWKYRGPEPPTKSVSAKNADTPA